MAGLAACLAYYLEPEQREFQIVTTRSPTGCTGAAVALCRSSIPGSISSPACCSSSRVCAAYGFGTVWSATGCGPPGPSALSSGPCSLMVVGAGASPNGNGSSGIATKTKADTPIKGGAGFSLHQRRPDRELGAGAISGLTGSARPAVCGSARSQTSPSPIDVNPAAILRAVVASPRAGPARCGCSWAVSSTQSRSNGLSRRAARRASITIGINDE